MTAIGFKIDSNRMSRHLLICDSIRQTVIQLPTMQHTMLDGIRHFKSGPLEFLRIYVCIHIARRESL